ncbi:hypothetical protein A3780_01820 [Kosakonia radicincitans]|nr:hypothetical protein A3780_01820 [Kosakonia radicincitans]
MIRSDTFITLEREITYAGFRYFNRGYDTSQRHILLTGFQDVADNKLALLRKSIQRRGNTQLAILYFQIGITATPHFFCWFIALTNCQYGWLIFTRVRHQKTEIIS